jgi:hypothetical protein
MDEMTHAEASMPATRGELKATEALLRGELKATETLLRGELKATETLLRGEIKTTESVLRGEIQAAGNALRGDLRTAVHGIAKEITQTQADISDIRHTMEGLSTKGDVDRILKAIDSFAGKAQNYDRAATLHGHSLTELQIQIKDHEGRIKDLESDRS